jgi:hypothetical protein
VVCIHSHTTIEGNALIQNSTIVSRSAQGKEGRFEIKILKLFTPSPPEKQQQKLLLLLLLLLLLPPPPPPLRMAVAIAVKHAFLLYAEPKE